VSRRPISANKARLAVLVNQCATPGLGSLMAGRYIAGTGQLLLALAGAALILLWFANILRVAYTLMESSGEPELRHWVGLLGFGLLFLAWCWSWISSLGILREVRRAQEHRMQSADTAATPAAVPPRLPGK
jgi:hypothetical protein